MNSTLVILGAGLAWLAFAARRPRAAIWLFLLWIPIQGWVQLNVLNDSNIAALIYEFQMIGLYVVFGAYALLRPAEFAMPPVMRFALPFVIWALLLVPFSLAETGLLVTLIGLRTHLLPLPLIWIGYHAFRSRGQLENVSVALALQAVLVAAVTTWQFTTLSSMSGLIFDRPVGYIDVGVLRPPGTFAHPGHLGNYILFMVPFGVGLLGLGTIAWKRLAFAAGLAATTVALVVNTQRAVIVLLALIVPLTIVMARGRQVITKGAAALIVMLLAGGFVGMRVAGYALEARIESIAYDLRTTIIDNPLARMVDALQTPVVGSGLGIASPGVGRLAPASSLAPTAERNESVKFGESFMASLVYETGVPGLLLYYVFLIAIVAHTFRALRACRGTHIEMLAAALFCFEIAILLHSWPYGPLRTPPARVLFWFWAGVLLRLPDFATQKSLASQVVDARRAAADRLAAIMARRNPVPSHRLAYGRPDLTRGA